MEIDLTGRTARIHGAETPLASALRSRIAASGAKVVSEGRADLLVLSAPLLPAQGFDWQGLAATARAEGATMQARGGGRIVFLLSAMAALPLRRAPEYSMEMAALGTLMRTLAMSLAPGVAVNALGAGALGEDAEHLVSGDSAMIGHAAVGRPGSLDEACAAALFLCDFDNTYLTGQILGVDGGWAAGYGRSF